MRPFAHTSWRHRARRLAASLVRIYLLYAACAFLLQRYLVFPRAFVPEGAPAPARTEEVWLETGEGKVEAWFLTGPSTAVRPAVLFAHGNGQLIDHVAPVLTPLVEMGHAVLLVEYPGYGRSAGTPTRESLLEAFSAGYDWLVARPEIDRTRITFMGHSMGGAVACDLTRARTSSRLVLVSTFTDLPSMFDDFLIPSALVRDRFDCADALREYAAPVLVLHGTDDDVVPFDHGRALALAAPNARFEVLRCAHNDCFSRRSGFWPVVERSLSGVMWHAEPSRARSLPPM